MVKQGRNEPCLCGSGKKAKRCCGSWRGPSPEAIDEAFMATALRETRLAVLVVGMSGLADGHLEELIELPARFAGLRVDLPLLVDLELEALLHCCQVGDDRGRDEVLPKVSRPFHAVSERARLARELLRLRDEEGLSRFLVALGIFDLSSEQESVLVEAAVLHAARVRAGVARTTSGLLIAS